MRKINLSLEANLPIKELKKNSLWRHYFPANRPRDVISGIVAAITAVVEFLGTTAITIGGVGITWGQIAYAAITVGLTAWSMISQKSAGRQMPAVDQNGQLINSRQSNKPLPVVYGIARVGGNWVFSRPSGSSNIYLNTVITWSEGPVKGPAPAVDYLPVYTESGGGYNDLHISGDVTIPNYNYVRYIVQIDGTGTPNTFKWTDIGDTSWNETLVPIVAGEWYELSNNVNIMFDSAIGHGNNDKWNFYLGDGIFTGERLIYYYKEYSNDDYAFQTFHYGTSDQNVDSSLQAEIPEWNSPQRYTAYSYLKLVTSTAWRGIPDYTILLYGRLLYDPRDGTTEFSRNPALVWLDWMTNARYGRGIPIAMIDLDSVEDVANWCDSHEYYFDGVVLDRKAFMDHLEDIMLNFKAYMIYSEGIYYLKVFAEDAAVMTLTEDDVEISPESFTISIPGAPESVKRAQVTIADKEQNHTANTISWPKTEIDFDPDALEGEITEKTLIGTNSEEQARKIAKFGYMRGQFDKQFNILSHNRCVALEPGDIVQITHGFPGWTNHRARVQDIGYLQTGLIPLTLTDEDASIHDETV